CGSLQDRRPGAVYCPRRGGADGTPHNGTGSWAQLKKSLQRGWAPLEALFGHNRGYARHPSTHPSEASTSKLYKDSRLCPEGQNTDVLTLNGETADNARHYA